MGIVLRSAGKLLKRARQLAYLLTNATQHRCCALAVANSQTAPSYLNSYKYLGDHLALSLTPKNRREALTGHHSFISALLSDDAARQVRKGVVIWRRATLPGAPPLTITLQPSMLAPMEGELELRFAFRSDLYVLTFLASPGRPFSSTETRILFIGGLQGLVGARDEIREAAKFNGEVAPAVALLIAVQAFAQISGVRTILAVTETNQVSMSYSAPLIRFDYRTFWSEMGGTGDGEFYVLPLVSPRRPLSETAPSHRSRTRRKRELKDAIRLEMLARLAEIFGNPADRRGKTCTSVHLP